MMQHFQKEAFMSRGKFINSSSIHVLFFGISIGVFFHYLLHRLIMSMESFIYIIF